MHPLIFEHHIMSMRSERSHLLLDLPPSSTVMLAIFYFILLFCFTCEIGIDGIKIET